MLDEEGIRRLLWERTHRMGDRGALSKFAAKIGVSPAFVGSVIAGKYQPSDKILNELGMRRIVQYVPVEDGQ